MLKGVTQERDTSTSDDVKVCVIDEGKNVRKTYSCSRELLASHVGYLAEIFKASGPEIKEVSIHCDINIFYWLLQWIKNVNLSPQKLPVLDAGNVLPVLVSAEFLVMEALVFVCLDFIHENINNMVLPENVLQLLNENTVSRLLGKFSNCEIEDIREENEFVKRRLYDKLLSSLLDGDASPRSGHYSSVANLFKCAACGQLVHSGVTQGGRQLSFDMCCIPANMMLSPSMEVISLHERDKSWNPKDHAQSVLKQVHRCARAAYWRIWGQCHFLYCGACSKHFPAGQMDWCPCHRAQQPQRMEEGRWVHPCCRLSAFPGDPLNDMPGCDFREHCPILETRTDNEVFKIYNKFKELIALPDDCRRCYSQYLLENFNDKDKYPWWNVLMNSPGHKNYFVPNIWEIYPESESSYSSKKDTPVKIIYERVRIANSTQMSTDGFESADGAREKSATPQAYKPRDGVVEGNFYYDKVSVRGDDSKVQVAERSRVPPCHIVEKKTINARRSCTGSILWSPDLPDHINIHHTQQHERKTFDRMKAYLERIAGNRRAITAPTTR